MIETIYVESQCLDHPRTREIIARFPRARVVECERYGEVFNRKAQSFRAQKLQPSLILARKNDGYVLPAPSGYAVGGARHFYFSHMLNCLYDCRYCFLQGMYRSANYVVFVNYEDFSRRIGSLVSESDEEAWFFSGYDCDSLALEPVTGFVSHMLEGFPRAPNAWLELRTKSTQIRPLLAVEPRENWVVAFSLSPEAVAAAVEHKAPSLERRLAALQRLQGAGWRVGVRLDPVLVYEGFEADYRALIQQIFDRVDPQAVHSVSVGGFRTPKGFFQKMVRMYPFEPLFAGPLVEENGMMTYNASRHETMRRAVEDELARFVSQEKVFACYD